MTKLILAILMILTYVGVSVAAVAGYILNVIHLAHHVGFGLLEVLRVVGIFMPPLGAIMGYM